MNNDIINIYPDFIDDSGYVQRYDYDKERYYNTGTCLKGAKGNPGNPGRPGKNGDSWDLVKVGDIYYWFKNGANTQIPAQINSETEHQDITPDANYVTVATFSDLPQTGEADTIYRVSSYDGTQVDASKYALYAWNGTTYVCLAVRSFVGEVYDISVNHPDGQGNPTPYADLTAVLGIDGANIPADIRRGGMSIKFIQGTVQSSDHKYVQYRLMADTFSTTESDWQGVDDVPTAGSHNLVESRGVVEYVSIIDEPYTHDKEFTEQFINYVNATTMVNNVDVIQKTDGTFQLNGTCNSSGGRYTALSNNFALTAGVYTCKTNIGLTIFFQNASDNSVYFAANNNDTITIPSEKSGNYYVGLNFVNGTTYDKTGFIRLEQSVIFSVGRTADDAKAREEVANINHRINGVNALSHFRGKRISIIGDSISTFDKEGYMIAEYRMYYPYGDVTDVNQTYWKKLIDICGGEIEVNASWSGSRVTNTRSGDGYPDFYDRIGLLGNPDIIIVELGQNDASAGSSAIPYGKYEYNAEIVNLSEAEFIPAYIKGIKGLKANYPNAEIWCIITNYPSGNHADRIKTAIKNIASHYALPCVDVSGYDDTGMSANHPSAYGMQFVVNKIAGYVDNRPLADNIKAIEEQSSVKQAIITFEQGGISGGSEVANQHRIRSGFIDIESFISAKVSYDYVLWAVLYDKDKNYLSMTPASKTSVFIKEITNANVRYIRFLIANSTNGIIPTVDDSAEVSPEDETGFVLYYDPNVGYINSKNQEIVDKKIRDNVSFDLLDIASVDNYYTQEDGTPIYSPSWTRYVIKGEAIINIAFKVFTSLNPTIYPYKAISFYNSTTLSTSTLISGVSFGDYVSGTMSQDIPVPPNCKVIAICTRNSDTPTDGVVLSGSINVAKIMAMMDDLQTDVDALIKAESDIEYDSVGNPEFWLNGASVYSDMTWVGNKLIGFSSSSDDLTTDAGTIYINVYQNGIKENRTVLYILKHLWGHCNTVDYNADNDCLILGNGSGDYTLAGKIIIIPNFSSVVDVSADNNTPMSLADVSALVIDCASYNLGGKFNLVWGDDNDKNYNIAYLLTANINGSISADGGDLETIRKIVLRKGETSGQYGSIVTNSTPFNGTFDIVETYRQTTEGYDNCDQGTCYYNGEIYAAIGHDGLWYWRMRMAYEKVFRKDYKQKTYYDNKPQNYGNASGVCVKDGYLFIGRSSLGVMAIRL